MADHGTRGSRSRRRAKKRAENAGAYAQPVYAVGDRVVIRVSTTKLAGAVVAVLDGARVEVRVDDDSYARETFVRPVALVEREP